MEDKKVKAGSVAVGICLFIIAILLAVIVFVFYNSTNIKNNLQLEVDELKASLEEKDKNLKEDEVVEKEEQNEINILEETYIPKEFDIDGNECYRNIMVSCGSVTATVKKDEKLEIVIGPGQGEEKTTINTVEGIDGEIIDLKLGIVKQQREGVEPFVRDVFVLTRTGDVYAVNITYGYRPDLVSKIETNVIKLENAIMNNHQDMVVAKKKDGTVVMCDDGESDGV